jgi:predicted nucleotidyltransferase
MSKVDERSHVPVIGEADRRRFAAALDRPGVVAAFLFGSQATGSPGPLSDVDVAVWLEPAPSPQGRYLDTAPLRDLAARSVRGRIEDGSFGRP